MDEGATSNDELSKYDIYGKTPPRMKISRKVRDKKQKQMPEQSSRHKPRPGFHRKNTMSTMYDELLAKADSSETGPPKRSQNKRHLKMLRDSERDLKLDIPRAQSHGFKTGYHQLHSGERTPSYHIEIDKKFMCLSGRSVPCHRQRQYHEPRRDVTDHKSNTGINSTEEDDVALRSRTEFYQTLSLLIRMGGRKDHSARRGISREESLWQTELKDLIWLELQAFHSNRTPMEEDEYLCQERESVEVLLNHIMNYRFSRSLKKLSGSLLSTDSGVEDDCPGCLSIYCVSCMEAQSEALKDVEALMKRLEGAEALFPSSKAFAELYPLYSSSEFNSRVKAISLWYNVTKMQRLKLGMLGKLILCLESKQSWPVICENSGTSSDSNTSLGSEDECCPPCDSIYTVIPIIQMIKRGEKDVISPYRRYIENILKTRTLNKSLRFLEEMHHFVLEKVQITLERPQDDDIFSKNVSDPIEELQRYGFWSPDTKNLDLPSYRALFLFLARIPLDFIQEYLRMRLEQKPDNPSPLSVRQLMRELKEGLKVGVQERAKLERYIAAVKCGIDSSQIDSETQLDNFDECMSKVFKDYLEYLEEWALLHQNNIQKNLLEEEYHFSLSVMQYIPQGFEMLTRRYLNILATIFQAIADRLTVKIDELTEDICTDDGTSLKQTLFSSCRELQCLFNEEREVSMKTMGFCKKIFGSLDKVRISAEEKSTYQKLAGAITALKCVIPHAIAKVQNLFELINTDELDEIDKAGLSSRIREILMQIYRFGFEFYKEMADSQYREKLVINMVKFSKLWMTFVTERCERGRGMRPRWATQGMEFLLTVCEPANTKYLSSEEFEDLKKSMDECISHLIGTTAPSTPDSGFISTGSPIISLDRIRPSRSRGASPIPRPNYKSQRSGSQIINRKISVEPCSPKSDQDEAEFIGSRKKDEKKPSIVTINLPPTTYSERIKEAVDTLDKKLDQKHFQQQLIGKVIQFTCERKTNLRKNVTFSWQRGIKIGQGRFGKVYTAVNNNTGEMMAVKEMQLQPNDQVTVKAVLGEMKILEGCNHENLVRYHGLEVYPDKLLIFMEYCAEGTLENLILATENGLPELLVRKYTYQLLSGVAALHFNGIVHRDIKPANIFLTDEGNCLKIGDFGCAAKIKSHTTMAGELQGLVGTQAYMAPEVFTKTVSDGHGRAADIWSVGCVVIEMASGKRPWHQYDSSYQIMFKVGMGQSPEPPEDMNNEGLDFLKLCFKHNPKERASADELLEHSYVKVGRDLN